MLAKDRITKVVEKWYLLEPLFFTVWALHRVEPTTHIKTIRVLNGHIEYNPIFIDSLSGKDLEVVLSFEAMRIILKHPYSRKKEIAQVVYQASNITIQEYLETTGLGFLSAKQFFGTDAYNKQHFEFYYDRILEYAEKAKSTLGNKGEQQQMIEFSKKKESTTSKNEKKNQQNDSTNDEIENKSQESKSTKEKSGNQQPQCETKKENEGDKEQSEAEVHKRDDGNKSPEEESFENQCDLKHYTNENLCGYENACEWDKCEYQEQLINEKIKEAEISNSWGSITGDIQEKILATLIPKINYKTILKSFRGSILSNKRRLTRMKPSRRYGFLYMGSRRDFTTKLLFAVDISGSVDSHALNKAFSILNRFFKYGIEEISVICFDTEIKGERLTLKKARKEIEVCGRGGTCFSAVTEYIDRNRSYDGVIIFTDGYAPCPPPPKNRKTKILWLFDNEKNGEYAKDTLSKLGKVAFVKEN